MWINLTESDVAAALNDGELEAYRRRVLEGEPDPMASLIGDVLAEIRGYVVTRYPLSAQGIPQGLKNAALDLVVYRLCKRVKTATEDQRKPAADDATTLLQRVAEGKHGIESATDSTTIAVAGDALPSVTERTRTFTRADQDGI
jgi:phage gp36-like protein